MFYYGKETSGGYGTVSHDYHIFDLKEEFDTWLLEKLVVMPHGHKREVVTYKEIKGLNQYYRIEKHLHGKVKEVVKLVAGWEVEMCVDEDGHLSVYIKNEYSGGNKPVGMDVEIGSETEWAERFTTELIEDDYNKNGELRGDFTRLGE
jgi:hypothetical protein